MAVLLSLKDWKLNSYNVKAFMVILFFHSLRLPCPKVSVN